jgi:hypothetical protein
VDDHNHALAALRYLISQLDAPHMVRLRKLSRQPDGRPEAPARSPSRKSAPGCRSTTKSCDAGSFEE